MKNDPSRHNAARMSRSSDVRDERFGPRQLGYHHSGEYRQPFAERTSMRSEREDRSFEDEGHHFGAGSWGREQDWDSLWGPSHYPHPGSSGSTWSHGSYGGDSNFGIGLGSGSSVGSDLGVGYQGANRTWVDREVKAEQPRYARGPKGYRRSDARIQEDLSERLHGLHDLDSSDVEVAVKDGVVTLTGTVPHREMRYRLESMAAQCLGAVDVVNEVKVKR